MSELKKQAPKVLPVAADDPRLQGLGRLIAVVDRLRAPDGCPWDLKQSVQSMAPSLIEEAYEAREAIDTGDEKGTSEELGDLLMVVVLIGRIAEDEGKFDLGRLAAGVAEKLIRRHPHVFASQKVEGEAEVLVNWEAIKRAEREAVEPGEEGERVVSALDGVPRALPALQRGSRIGDKAVAAGFRWEDAQGALSKLEEEFGELKEAFDAAGTPRGAKELLQAGAERKAELEHELGDLIASAIFFGNYLGLDAERVAADAVRRFEGRFRHMEAALGGTVGGKSLEELMAAWELAKRAQSASGGSGNPPPG